MSYSNAKISKLKWLTTLIFGLLLYSPMVFSADTLPTSSISYETPASNSQLRLQAHINQLFSNSYSNDDVTNVRNENNEDSSLTSSNSQSSNITSVIQNNYVPPANSEKGQSTLKIKLDKSGKVLSVSASGPNELINRAATEAVMKASPLPIDLKNASDYSDILVHFQTR